jgi:SAM-dependent methyltransferase
MSFWLETGMLLLAALVLVALPLFLIASVVYLVAAERNVVPAVFTPGRAVGEVLDALDLPERGLLVDLGCGDGRLLKAALARRPALRVVGVENNPVVYLMARLRLRGRGTVAFGQLERLDLTRADRVFAYLGPGSMAELAPFFEKELKHKARLVSQQFPLPDRAPKRIIKLRNGKSFAARLYVYDY